jgi:DNA-binding HxlR family transcriptional regulator
MGKKWSLSILKTLGTNFPLHFNELKGILAGISNKVIRKITTVRKRENSDKNNDK